MFENLSPVLKEKWQQKGFREGTPIQEQVFERIKEQHSLIAISPTGSGKTLAYLLPLLELIERNHTLQLLIFAPSQELAKQISEVVKEWGGGLGLRSQLLLGSANIKRQLEALKRKPEIIVATPGRFVEILEQSNKIKLHQVRTVVYDEADYLLQDDQRQAIDHIKKRLMREVQAIWVSATLGNSLIEMNKSLENPLEILMNEDLPTSISHYAIVTNNRQKMQTLKRLAQIENMRAIVFFDQVTEVDIIASKLTFEGVKVAVLHSKVSKIERESAIKQIKGHQITFLLATDVTARGLDIEDLPYVIHYNKPGNIQTYLHRSGRTGRMGKKGSVISLVNEQELRDVSQILETSDLSLSERFVYQGQLLGKEEKDQLKDINIQQEKAMTKPKKKEKLTHIKVKVKAEASKSKKKNRHRDQKNKGKRRPKGDK